MRENKKASNAREDGQARRRARQTLPLTRPGKPRRPARGPRKAPPPRRARLRARTGTPAAPLSPARPLAPGWGSLRPAVLCRAVPARDRAREAACCSLVKSGQLCKRSGRGRARRRGRRTGAPKPLGSCRPSRLRCLREGAVSAAAPSCRESRGGGRWRRLRPAGALAASPAPSACGAALYAVAAFPDAAARLPTLGDWLCRLCEPLLRAPRPPTPRR